MKALLFISALAFNVALCIYPFSETANAPRSEARAVRVPIADEPESTTQLTGFSQMLKNKAMSLPNRNKQAQKSRSQWQHKQQH